MTVTSTSPKTPLRPRQYSKISDSDRSLTLLDLLQDRRYAENTGSSKNGRTLNDFFEWALRRTGPAKAQLFQDLWVQWELGEKVEGYFFEFGATNGVDLSNTHLLEKEFGWSGILVEPNPIFHSRLYRERQCYISDKCVFSSTGQKLSFNCTEISHLSRLVDVVPEDNHERQGKRSKPQQVIGVETISLNDLGSGLITRI